LQLFRPLEAQPYLQPELFPVDNNLSSRHVACLSFDKKGYLWIGTQSGLSRYDGYNFVQFISARNGQYSVNDQRIKVIRRDKQDNLWILSDGGLSLYNRRSGEIRSYSLPDSLLSEARSLKDIYPGNQGEIWLLSDKKLISLRPGQPILDYSIPRAMNQPEMITRCILADEKNNVWLGTSQGIVYFDRLQKNFREFMPQNSQGLLSDNLVNCLFRDADNILWIGTQNGLNRFDPIDYVFEGFFPGFDAKAQPANEIKGIDQDPDGMLIVATSNGLFSFDRMSGMFTRIRETTDLKFNAISVDSFGTIWGGTNQGIIKIRRSRFSVRNFTSRGPDFTLSDDRISILAAGSGNSVFVGYFSDVFDIADFNTLSRRSIRTADGNRVVGIYPFRNQEYMIVTEHDVEILNAGQTLCSSYSAGHPFVKKELLNEISLTCAYFDGNSNLWLGTSAGLQNIRFDSARHNSIRTIRRGNENIEIGRVYDIETDQDNNLWLGTASGLLLFDPRHGNFYRYTPYDKAILNTENKEVYTILAESPKLFWIGTSRGAYRFDVQTREFTAIINDPVFLGSQVRALAKDGSGKIWIGSGRGLYYPYSGQDSPLFFDQHDGLVNFGYSAICSGKDGFIYLGGREGLSVVDPGSIRPVTGSAGVVITSLRVIENDPQKESIQYQVPDTVVLPWARKPIQINFSSMNLSRIEFSKYRYSLEKAGNDPVWHPLGEQNYVILDHLSPGKYQFNVTSADVTGSGNTHVTVLAMVIEAPGWRSRIALIIYSIAGLLLIILVLSGLIRRFFRMNRENLDREMFARQIMLQKEELTLKNKSITDSINYARRIQTAMLPPYRLFKSIFSSSFVLYMPKDIVSGDFYWINKLNDKIFVAAVDCTGHGVPGAFMSIIGFELFRKITNMEGLTRPSDILNRLNEDFHVIFKDVDNVVLRDGMDVAFCSIDKKNMILEFAGAFNPLYLIRDNKITEIKGDRFAIGLDETNFKDQTFKNHLIPIQLGDIIYIFSDGFADQFGGPDGKKYKYRRFRHLLLNLHQLPMEKQHEILENNVMEWRGHQEQVDDILVIGIKIDF